MSNDDIAKEREFLANLSGDTGRDLAAWMDAIKTSAHSERNDIIDWLRAQGFTFSKASWLERIHHNNGRPIYIEDQKQSEADTQNANFEKPKLVSSSPALENQEEMPPPKEPQPPPTLDVAEQNEASTLVPADVSALEKTLSAGKAYRPLAQYLLQEITLALPSATCHPTTYAITIANPNPFAVLDITTKGLRFALSLETADDDSPLDLAKFPNPSIRVAAQISQGLTHLAILTDARQVNDVLIAEITRSSKYVNGIDGGY